MAQLAVSAGIEPVGHLHVRRDRPDPAHFVGAGKVEELKALAEETLTNVVVFDDELSPRHQRELENTLGEHVRVLDRTALILDIFAQHAHTAEGMLQVELAQLEYRLPRL
ncbi:MAG TPA: GTPase HflX, partial [Burkholderiaceae bacterium]|nr:GTPase HflX [Burkholderiaceae bacterium]